MATVRIDIPNIGVVEADNAATEDTLLEILAAMNAANNKDTPKDKKSKKADEDAAKAAEDKAKADRQGTKVGKEFNVGLAAAGNAAVKGLKDIGLTAISMATKLGTDFIGLAENPIKGASEQLNTMIDAGAKFAGGLAEAIPYVGGFIKALIEASAELLKAANKTFADQLQRNIDALQTYAKAGISFSGGLKAMNLAAHSAGLTVLEFSKIVKDNHSDLMMLGVAGGDAATRLASAMGKAEKMIGKSGQSLRTEMFKMGFTYEEQGAIFASYMASQASAGKLRAMTDKEIAEGTRNYARDLKVVADFTGQDAKKLAERARAQQLMVAAQQQLSKADREQLGKASMAFARMGPEGERATQALTQMMLRGTTNIQGYTMGPGRKMIEDVMNGIRVQGSDAFKVVGHSMADAQQAMSQDMTQGAISVAKAFNVGGEAVDGFTQFQQGLYSKGILTTDAIEKMGDAAEKQATQADKTLDQTAALYDQTKKFAVTMETEVNKHLGTYAGILKEVNEEMLTGFLRTLRKLTDMSPEDKIDEQIWKNSEGFWESLDYIISKGVDETVGVFSEDAKRYLQQDRQASQIEWRKDHWQGEVPNLPKHADGGFLGAGKLGIAGERGPELISGPANILSTLNTQKLESVVESIAQSKTSTSPSIMQSNNSELVERMDELVRLMKQNVDHTARVAVNTN